MRETAEARTGDLPVAPTDRLRMRGVSVTDEKKSQTKYTVEQRIEALVALEKNGGCIAETVRQTGVSKDTIRRWREEVKTEATANDLKRFQKDAWEIIHRANEVVRENVGELGAKDAASIAAGYFDRQAKAQEQLGPTLDENETYVAEWGAESNHRDTETRR
jgi:transposase-like protein